MAEAGIGAQRGDGGRADPYPCRPPVRAWWTGRGSPFPNAVRVFVATEELMAFRAEPRMIPVLPRLMALEQGDGPMPSVTAINAPGHSPGHMAFLVEGRLLIWGDLVHHAAVHSPGPR